MGGMHWWGRWMDGHTAGIKQDEGWGMTAAQWCDCSHIQQLLCVAESPFPHGNLKQNPKTDAADVVCGCLAVWWRWSRDMWTLENWGLRNMDVIWMRADWRWSWGPRLTEFSDSWWMSGRSGTKRHRPQRSRVVSYFLKSTCCDELEVVNREWGEAAHFPTWRCENIGHEVPLEGL